MKNNKKYTKQSYWIEERQIKNNFGKWAVIVISKNDLRVIDWFKSLKEAIKIGEAVKNPIYFLSAPSASGLFVPVSVGYKNKRIKILCIVDSGCYCSTFSKEVGDVLGIDFKKNKKEKVYGINGALQAYSVNNISITLPKEKISIKLVANFVRKKYVPSLLGCYGFFDFYEVSFSPDYGMKFKYIGEKK